MKASLLDQLPSSGHSHELLANGRGGGLLIREQGARALALWASDEDDSAFWYAGSVPQPDNPWNTGGDRTWISPEEAFFANDSGEYEVPSQLDPGDWKLSRPSPSRVVANMACQLIHHPSRRPIDLELEKRFELAPNPYAMNSSSANPGNPAVFYIGYEVHTRLKLTPGDSSPDPAEVSASLAGYCNLWSIMQVPPGGKILVPTYGSVTPLKMFASTESVKTEPLPHGFRIPCEGSYSFKLSVDALSSTGRFGYARRLDDNRSSLVIRQFSVRPSAVYPDYPPDNPRYRGSCMQFFFDGGSLGNFAELEYHTPALALEAPGLSEDVSQVYYFVGPAQEVEKIAQDLLGLRPY
ncbi:DUF6786 family protein [Paenibacillus sp. GCM10027626]|uniref:DUF6786 family protein n=1 Tax=Paenibacillus sp. GCM10027626 TaxID=3273411 RepID=UPI0036398CAD